MGELLKQIRHDNMQAMKEKDEVRKGVCSLLISAIALAEKESGKVLEKDEELVFVQKELKQTKEELESILSKMDEDVIRVKGYVNGKEGTLYLNYVLNEYHVFYGEKKDESLVVAIGSKLDEQKIREAFHD